ncbi:hypothetical protein FK178_00295 [Antarcticibacterium arcticum]|uniref:Peptidase E n=1 Tax=Antarcticibacterium arcticum TaxID=2585771 RepID=A0A5B8YI32_9FLAO|nr:DUF6702 family protein [Antarcticibacterium arcticum]QED36263.1 hypothetical protein FK178_00295 [Antarcticibacterium arcticum]
MKSKILFLLIIFSLSSFSAVHKFYVSVTEIEHNGKNKSLQIISRVFTDDLESVLKTRFDPEIRLGKKVETPGVDAYIEKYLGQRFTVEVDGKPLEIKFLGKEYENDMTLFYLEIPEVKEFSKITVKNTILLDMFEEQKNLIHVQYKGKTKSLILAEGKERDVLNF